MAELSFEDVQRIKFDIWRRPKSEPEATAVALEDAKPKPLIIAEGDSWFDYPPGLDIIDHLQATQKYEIQNFAEHGDTLENMVYGTAYKKSNYNPSRPQFDWTLQWIKDRKPSVFLFSGGGNDVAGAELEAFLDHAGSGGSPLRVDYAKHVFDVAARKTYEKMIADVTAAHPKIHIFAHGYAEPFPDGRHIGILGFDFAGPWLRPALTKKRVLDPVAARGVLIDLMKMFNALLADLAKKHANFHYLDLRDVVTEHKQWVNELHLTNDSYAACAKKFEAAIDAVL